MKNYDNFFLPVNDIDTGKNFYQGILGLSIKFDFSEKRMIGYKVGNEEHAIILKDYNKFPDVKPTIWFEVNSVTEKYKNLKEKGVKLLSEPFNIKTRLAVEFEDPSGNRLGITDYSNIKPN